MKDDLQRFRLFDAAVKLVTKSTNERGEELSERMDSLLSTITQLMCRVVRKILYYSFLSDLKPLRIQETEGDMNMNI